ncbi:MAG: HDOD domain-containing protein [Deltaproteobacteria bacterium]|nr:HDOD domain-containing protein [Deltaproteobacteria bacterium]
MGPNPRDLSTLVEKNLEIPTIPVVAAEALQALANADVSATALSKIISQDHGLTARLLKLSNSALYSPAREVRNIPQACMTLGFRVLKGVVVAASCRSIYKQFGAVEKILWQHSVACAVVANFLARAKRIPNADEAFVSGLMHDIGKVVMNHGDRKKFEKAMTAADADRLTTLDAEIAVFGFTHADVGAVLVKRWELSSHLQQAVLFHHEPDLASSLAEESVDLVRVTNAADLLCHKLGLGTKARAQAQDELDESQSLADLGFEPEDMADLEAKIVAAYTADRGTLD